MPLSIRLNVVVSEVADSLLLLSFAVAPSPEPSIVITHLPQYGAIFS